MTTFRKAIPLAVCVCVRSCCPCVFVQPHMLPTRLYVPSSSAFLPSTENLRAGFAEVRCCGEAEEEEQRSWNVVGLVVHAGFARDRRPRRPPFASADSGDHSLHSINSPAIARLPSLSITTQLSPCVLGICDEEPSGGLALNVNPPAPCSRQCLFTKLHRCFRALPRPPWLSLRPNRLASTPGVPPRHQVSHVVARQQPGGGDGWADGPWSSRWRLALAPAIKARSTAQHRPICKENGFGEEAGSGSFGCAEMLASALPDFDGASEA